MPRNFTISQITALAPDDASVKSSKEISQARNWKTLGVNESVLWGECQGSGKSPYQTIVDFTDIAFKCSCPSRKFPCKHGLGLLLYYERDRERFPNIEDAPNWVQEWQIARAARQEKKAPVAAAEEHPKAFEDSAAAARRHDRVTAGLVELKLWLCDLLRHGLADVSTKGYSYWDNIAARLIDAQAPGLARDLREMAGISSSGPGWQLRLLRQISLVHLLIEGYGNRSELPEPTVGDILNKIGWTVGKEDLSRLEPVNDHWFVVGQRIVEEDRLRARRTWLVGQASGRTAMLLHFAHGIAPFETIISTGDVVSGDIVYYPGANPLRAALNSYSIVEHGSLSRDGFSTLDDAIRDYSQAVCKNPWIERYPLFLNSVTPGLISGKLFVSDNECKMVPVALNYDRTWKLLALSGSRPIGIFAEWDGDAFWPLSIFDNGKAEPI